MEQISEEIEFKEMCSHTIEEVLSNVYNTFAISSYVNL